MDAILSIQCMHRVILWGLRYLIMWMCQWPFISVKFLGLSLWCYVSKILNPLLRWSIGILMGMAQPFLHSQVIMHGLIASKFKWGWWGLISPFLFRLQRILLVDGSSLFLVIRGCMAQKVFIFT